MYRHLLDAELPPARHGVPNCPHLRGTRVSEMTCHTLRMMRHRIPLGVGVALSLSILGSPWTSPAAASCVSPQISIIPSAGPPGTTITITGTGWFVGCNDTTQSGAAPPPMRPDGHITVAVSGPNWPGQDIATVAADSTFRFTYHWTIPTNVSSDQLRVTANGANGFTQASFAVEHLPGLSPPVSTQGGLATTGPDLTEMLKLATTSLSVGLACTVLAAFARRRPPASS